MIESIIFVIGLLIFAAICAWALTPLWARPQPVDSNASWEFHKMEIESHAAEVGALDDLVAAATRVQDVMHVLERTYKQGWDDHGLAIQPRGWFPRWLYRLGVH